MPELPEVEVTRRGLAGPLWGARVLGLRLGKPLRWPLACEPEGLTGLRVGAIGRRGKYLWLPLWQDRDWLAVPGAEPGASNGSVDGIDGSPGAPQPAGHGADPASAVAAAAGAVPAAAGGLLMHLGMSGSLALLSPAPTPGSHDHFDLVTDCGTLRLNDPRRFGAVLWSPAQDQAPAAQLLARLGPEPFDPLLTPATFHAALHRRRTPIKTLLLGGEVVVGAGNIYACEALFQAGIHPALRADRISRPRAAALLMAVRSTLSRALALGGSTLRDFSDVHGASGQFQAEAAVYGRAGLPCLRCGAPVQRAVQQQRSTYYCKVCQRR